MELFDLHCDTLGECLKTGKSLFQNDMQLDVRRGLSISPWVQCFAVWIPDEMRGEEAVHFLTMRYGCWIRKQPPILSCAGFLTEMIWIPSSPGSAALC